MNEMISETSQDGAQSSSTVLADPASARVAELQALLDTPATRRFGPLEVTIVRELTPEDMLAALDGAEISGATNLKTIRHSHHKLAMLLSEGKSTVQVALLTGYSPTYVLRLQQDPVFRELLAYYLTQVEAIHVETSERMKTLSLSAMDELQERLETDPAAWTKKDLMELVKITSPAAANPGTGGQTGPASGAPSVALTVQFVAPTESTDPNLAKPIIDITARVAPEQEI